MLHPVSYRGKGCKNIVNVADRAGRRKKSQEMSWMEFGISVMEARRLKKHEYCKTWMAPKLKRV